MLKYFQPISNDSLLKLLMFCYKKQHKAHIKEYNCITCISKYTTTYIVLCNCVPLYIYKDRLRKHKADVVEDYCKICAVRGVKLQVGHQSCIPGCDSTPGERFYVTFPAGSFHFMATSAV